jgi:antitoxin ParD1/3/4
VPKIATCGSKAARNTVNISITPAFDAFLQSCVDSGRYQTISEVVREALRLLQHQEQARQASLSQLKAKLRRGVRQAERGELIDGEQVFDEMGKLIQKRRRARKTATRE